MADDDKLLVLPNPYAALDAKGRPAAAFALEGLSGRDRYLGAQIDAARTKKIGRVVFVPSGYEPKKGAGDAHLMNAWASMKPLEVPDTHYYRMALRRGDDVLPGDERTARLVGLPKETPVGAAALEAARKRACEHYRAAHGVAAACEAPSDESPKESETIDTPADKGDEENAP